MNVLERLVAPPDRGGSDAVARRDSDDGSGFGDVLAGVTTDDDRTSIGRNDRPGGNGPDGPDSERIIEAGTQRPEDAAIAPMLVDAVPGAVGVDVDADPDVVPDAGAHAPGSAPLPAISSPQYPIAVSAGTTIVAIAPQLAAEATTSDQIPGESLHGAVSAAPAPSIGPPVADEAPAATVVSESLADAGTVESVAHVDVATNEIAASAALTAPDTAPTAAPEGRTTTAETAGEASGAVAAPPAGVAEDSGADTSGRPTASQDAGPDGVRPIETPGSQGTDRRVHLGVVRSSPDALADASSSETDVSGADGLTSTEAHVGANERPPARGFAEPPRGRAVTGDLGDGGADESSIDAFGPDVATRPTDSGATARTVAARLADHTALREMIERIERQRLGADGSLEIEIRTERFGLLRVEAIDAGDGIQLSLRGDGSGTAHELAELARELRSQLDREGVDVGAFDLGARGRRDRDGSPGGDTDDRSSDSAGRGADSVGGTTPDSDSRPAVVTDGLDLRM